MSATRRILGSFTGLVLLLAVAGCGDDDNKASTEATTTSTTSTAPTTPSSNVNDHGSKSFAGDDEGEVELDDDYFAPTTIQGTAGQSIKLELRNEGQAEHNFTLTDQNIDKDVEAGEDVKVTVEIPQSGTVEFFCKYHKAQGMAGKLAVAGGSGGGSSGTSTSGTTTNETTTESDGSSGSGGGY